MHYVDGKTMETVFHGVEINIRVGFLRTFDVLKCIDILTELYVLWKIPAFCCGFVLMYCLGHMSGVYRSIIRKEWNVVQHMVFAVMNTIINSQTFDSLAGPDGEITELLLRKKLAHSVKGYKQLEDFEVQVLANFCWRSALSIEDNRYAH